MEKLFGIYVLTLLPITFTQVTFEGTGDYCQLEKFNATCGNEEIIVMLSARYGRMRPGRCISHSYGNVGCAADVLPYLDSICSGKQTCEISIPDPNLHKKRTCPKDFTTYLQASYQCIRVANIYNRECSSKHKKDILVAGEGFILGAIPDHPENPEASFNCPWRISTSLGQHINLTLINFSQRYNRIGTLQSSDYAQCVDVAVAMERTGIKETLQLCPQQKRERFAYLSKGSELTLYTFHKSSSTIPNNIFLWRYKAEGCADLDPKPNLWIRRNNDQTIVKCNATEETWYLVCQEGIWKGRLGNCTKKSADESTTQSSSRYRTVLPFGILITVAIGVALGIFLGGILLIAVFIFKRYRKSQIDEIKRTDYDTRDILQSKHSNVDIYGPVLDDCAHYPMPSSLINKNTLQSDLTSIDILPESHYNKDYVCPHMDQKYIHIHKNCHLHDKELPQEWEIH